MGRRLLASGWWRGALARKRQAWAKVEKNIRRLAAADRVRRGLGTEAPATAGTETHTARRRSRYALPDLTGHVVGMVIGVPWGLRHPRRLTVLAIAMEACFALK